MIEVYDIKDVEPEKTGYYARAGSGSIQHADSVLQTTGNFG